MLSMVTEKGKSEARNAARNAADVVANMLLVPLLQRLHIYETLSGIIFKMQPNVSFHELRGSLMFYS